MTRKLPILRKLPIVAEPARKYSLHLTRVVSSVSFDCLACGACCMPPKDGDKPPVGWTDLLPTDFAKLTRHELKKHVEKEDGDFVISLVNHDEDGLRCSLLGGRVGVRAPCKIYERRPETCSAFTMGSRACLDAREAAGMATSNTNE